MTLACVSRKASVTSIRSATATCLPAIQPYRPRSVIILARRGSERPVLMFKSPEEECIIRRAPPLYWEVARPVPGQIEGDVREWAGHLKICGYGTQFGPAYRPRIYAHSCHAGLYVTFAVQFAIRRHQWCIADSLRSPGYSWGVPTPGSTAWTTAAAARQSQRSLSIHERRRGCTRSKRPSAVIYV